MFNNIKATETVPCISFILQIMNFDWLLNHLSVTYSFIFSMQASVKVLDLMHIRSFVK